MVCAAAIHETSAAPAGAGARRKLGLQCRDPVLQPSHRAIANRPKLGPLGREPLDLGGGRRVQRSPRDVGQRGRVDP